MLSLILIICISVLNLLHPVMPDIDALLKKKLKAVKIEMILQVCELIFVPW